MKASRLLSLAAPLLLLSGCATTLSTMDTARPTPVGHVRANAALGLYVPAGAALEIIDTGTDLADRAKRLDARLTPEEAETLYEAALTGMLMPPAPLQEFMIRTGVHEDADVGLRLATTSVRLDAKYRFYGADDGHSRRDASIGLGGSKYTFKGLVFDVLDMVDLGNFSRWDFEVPVLYSYERGEWLQAYLGAKYMISFFSYDENLMELQNRVASHAGLEAPPLEHRKSTMHFVGGVGGVGLGYKYAFLFLELTAGYTMARPSIYSFVDRETRERKLGGFTLYPSVGLVLRI
jgi:hypothetical protein